MNAVRAADRLGASLAQAEVAYLSLLDETSHCTDGIFDRHGPVDTMLVIKVDHVDPEALEARLTGALHILRPAIDIQSGRRAHRVHPLAAVQTEYSLLYRIEAEETLVTTRELGIAFVAYSPLGRGLLTGSIHAHSDVAGDRRADHPRFARENFAHNLKLVDRIAAIAKEKACTSGQLALAWLLAQGADVVPIPGTKKRERLDENVGALDIRLSQADLYHISSAIPPREVAGLRYPEPLMKTVYQ